MKNKFFTALFIVATLGFTSCNSDDSSPVNNPPVNTATFTAIMDGEAFVATQATAVQEDNKITITGIRGGNGEKVTLKFLATSPGTLSNSFMDYLTETDGELYFNTNPIEMDINGSITVSSIQNNTVSGSFEFTAYPTGGSFEPVVFESGEFNNVPLTVIPNEDNASIFVSAKIDDAVSAFTDVEVTYSAGNIIISGTNEATSQIVNITMPDAITVGSHSILPGAISIGNGAQPVTSVIGVIYIIHKDTGRITGSFTFTGNNGSENIQVTEGEFNVLL